jgi:hypothetical protein
MSKFDSILKAVKIGSGVAKVFVPGAVGKVLDEVNKNLESDPTNTKAIEALAKDNDEQTQAILALHERVKKLENK